MLIVGFLLLVLVALVVVRRRRRRRAGALPPLHRDEALWVAWGDVVDLEQPARIAALMADGEDVLTDEEHGEASVLIEEARSFVAPVIDEDRDGEWVDAEGNLIDASEVQINPNERSARKKPKAKSKASPRQPEVNRGTLPGDELAPDDPHVGADQPVAPRPPSRPAARPGPPRRIGPPKPGGPPQD